LERWSVRSFFEIGWQWPKEIIKPLGVALDKRAEVVDRKKHDVDSLKLVTLHFDGEMEPRDLRGSNGFKGRLFFAHPGDVIYSKIDVRNGAIGVVSNEFGTAAVSSEYPVYRIKPEIALPQYIKLLFRTSFFRDAINSMISGASGRKRVQPSQLEEIEIPLPPLPAQRAIVGRWRAAQEAVAAAGERIARIERATQARFLADLGLTLPERATPPKAFALKWQDLERWSVMFNQMAATGVDVSASKYGAVPLSECLQGTMNGYCIRPVGTKTKHKMLKLSALRPEGLDLTESKYVKVPEKIAKRFHIIKGDLLICRSVGSFDHIAKCALVEEDRADILFPDIIIRARFNDMILPEYAGALIQSPIGRLWFQKNARTAVGMWKIGGGDIAAFPIPLPPLSVQRAMMERVEAGRAEIAREREAADRLRRETQVEVEETILGKRKVS